ncbi:MAG: DUF6076 domain-containing protein [Clostridiales bacterium]|jgi:hypothetical protein|nr:DUF6076 domain-containing protein [Clostridiales bacterium]
MTKLIFSADGYRLCRGSELDGYSFYSEDSRHQSLINYINEDISNLQNMLESFVENIIDIKTFEFKIQQDNLEKIFYEIIEELKKLHPFYQYNAEMCLKRALIRYFKDLLIKDYKESGVIRDHKLYLSICERLLAFIPSPEKIEFDIDCFEEYREYADITGERFKAEWKVVTHISNLKIPTAFDEEITTQAKVRGILNWVLDAAAPQIGNADVNKRLWIYNHLFGETKVNAGISLGTQPAEFYSNNHENHIETEYLFENRKYFKKYSGSAENLPAIARKELERYLTAGKSNFGGADEEVYIINDLRQLLMLEIMRLIKCGKVFKRCKYCGNYFIPGKFSRDYCGNVAKNEKEACYRIGANRVYYADKKEDKLQSEYGKAYKRYYARYAKKQISRDIFGAWQGEALLCLEKARLSKTSPEEFAQLLKEIYNGTVTI